MSAAMENMLAQDRKCYVDGMNEIVDEDDTYNYISLFGGCNVISHTLDVVQDVANRLLGTQTKCKIPRPYGMEKLVDPISDFFHIWATNHVSFFFL